MTKVFSWLLGMALLTGTALAQEKKEEKKPEAAPAKKAEAGSTNEVAVIKTKHGEMVLEFWPEVAPKHVENFKTLARKGFYDGTTFHRIFKGFMIQGGDPNTKDPAKESTYGQGGPGSNINAEFNERKHVRGVLSMARSANPNSAGSQFFIMLDANPGLDRQYTAFGKLIKGDDVLTKIGDTPVVPNPYDPRRERSKPTERVELQSVKIVPADSVK